jgi:hypothetical protein
MDAAAAKHKTQAEGGGESTYVFNLLEVCVSVRRAECVSKSEDHIPCMPVYAMAGCLLRFLKSV